MRAVVLALVLAAMAPASARSAPAATAVASFDTVLARHVRGGRVDYGALARDRGPLDRFLAATRDAKPDGWPRGEQVAFWVNAYNARVLDGVVRRPGLKSVLDPGRTLGVPTMKFFDEKRKTAGRSLSLNDIEHEILRERFAEPRVHFVLNCASASCPALPAHPLTAATLDSVLDAATRAFLADRVRNPVVTGGTLRLSSIFRWYRGDFEAAAGNLPAFLRRFLPAGAAIAPDARIEFVDYDWSLNGTW